MNPGNHGFNLELEKLHQDGTEFQFGAVSQPGIVSIPPDMRDSYLPVGELQYGVEDFQDCATRGPINDLQMQFTYLYQNNLLHPENKTWLEGNGYVINKRIVFSKRFNAIKSGTTREGNSLKAPCQSIHSDGLIPEIMLPQKADMNFDQYHDKTKITDGMVSTGKEFLRRFPITYEQVQEIHYAQLLIEEAIVGAGNAWMIPVNGEYPNPGDAPVNHCFLIYKTPKYYIFDNYVDSVDGDFIKKLASDYNLFDYGYRIFVTAENVVNDVQQNALFTWLSKMITWILNGSKPPMPPIPQEILPKKNSLK